MQEPVLERPEKDEKGWWVMAKRRTIARRTLFDSLPASAESNLYCDVGELVNEASVETFFVNRMLADLEYRDSHIKTKRSISELVIALGSKSIKYKPDYVLVYRKKPRWVIDAKSPDENLDKWVPQCSGYCLALNQGFTRDNPVRWFVLKNGIETRVYEWDNAEPLLTLAFSPILRERNSEL